jgi:hypothetical protein
LEASQLSIREESIVSIDNFEDSNVSEMREKGESVEEVPAEDRK